MEGNVIGFFSRGRRHDTLRALVGAPPLNNGGAFNASFHVYRTVYLVKQHPGHSVGQRLGFMILCIPWYMVMD
ncbi:hypothetical protein PILCRDRAFT_16967 [Piloderma croceum F 1598]|uniref:Uncharacterized protein n=1 Tax=Piloderma croceum (strain F 1598) TaxID=765440 RepID=A0A0C3EFW4_PILCF|nr:hypothetical protein PILCRDRAFT_16967 [Piloderma croceum F 1598]